jgi:chloramphenicol 3-O phosphotransferase
MDIIILNGASSSGKSSLAKELQNQLSQPYLHIGIDTFITMMPDKCNALDGSKRISDGFYWASTRQDEQPLLTIQRGAYGHRINQLYRSTVKHFADSGFNVIVDDVMNGQQEQVQWQQALEDHQVTYVGVFCDEDILNEREKNRDDRQCGTAIEQARRVHVGVGYDVIVDTSQSSANECADRIVLSMQHV